MDGVGIGKGDIGDAVKSEYPTLDWLRSHCPYTQIKAHGTAVGLPSDEDMGNSEVGHNALGCGQIYSQGAKLVNESIENGSIFHSETWNKLIGNCVENHSTLHFIGLLSDGNVHSNINHLKAMIREAKNQKSLACGFIFYWTAEMSPRLRHCNMSMIWNLFYKRSTTIRLTPGSHPAADE